MKIHHWLIPSKHNKFHPHALRASGMLAILAVLVLIPPLYNMVSVGKPQVLGYAVDVDTTAVFNFSNQERTNAGLAPLTLNPALVSAAKAKANHMIANNYWAHVAPDGTTPWTFVAASNYDYAKAGENLAKDFNTSSGVVTGWMNSSSHRSNVLSNDFRDVGYAVVNGTLLGSETTLVVAIYGVQTIIEPVAAVNPIPSQPANTESVVATTQPTTNTTATASPEIRDTVTTTTKAPTNTATATKTKQVEKGNVAGTFISLPVETYNSFNWGQKASLLIISTMTLLFVMKHTMIWRQQKRGLRNIWLRAHPIGQAMILAISIIVMLANGVGVVL